MSSRPFMILGIQQIAIGGLDKARLRRLWVDTLGLAPAGNYRSERENVDEDILVARRRARRRSRSTSCSRSTRRSGRRCTSRR